MNVVIDEWRTKAMVMVMFFIHEGDWNIESHWRGLSDVWHWSEVVYCRM